MNTNTTKKSNQYAVLPDELLHLLTAFLPSNPTTDRTEAFITLNAYCQGVRASSTSNSQGPPNTEALVGIFSPLVRDRLVETDEDALLAGMTFFTALFQVDRESASSIFQQHGVLDNIMDSVDLTPSTQLARSVAQLLSQACGYKPCREALSAQAIQWLNFTSQKSPDTNTRASATTALIKISNGTAADNAEATENLGGAGNSNTRAGVRKDEDLAAAMREIVVAGDDQASVPDAVEGIAYLSINPVIKEVLSNDVTFLKRLSALMHRHTIPASPTAEPPTTLAFGILLIVSNLCTRRPRLTEEQMQIQQLRQMAKSSSADVQATPTSILDDDEHVRARTKRIINAGLLDIFSLAMKADTSGVRLLAAKALLSIVEDNDHRGKVLQSGGVKVLMQILRHIDPGSASRPLEPAYLSAIQALAKLAITASPFQVFGPNEGAIYDAIRPLSLMLQGSSSTLLQQFESMMALTNLSSQSAEIATRIANSEGLLNQVELLLLEDHTLVRRAAMELLCNLIAGSDETFERYGGENNLNSTQSKLHIVLALSDVDDLPTRLAASGAIATLTSAPSACTALVALQSEKHRVFPILAGLIDPSVRQDDDGDEIDGHPGLVQRAIVCTRNVFLSISDKDLRTRLTKEAEEAGLVEALVNFMKNAGEEIDPAILEPAVEVLKAMTSRS